MYSGINTLLHATSGSADTQTTRSSARAAQEQALGGNEPPQYQHFFAPAGNRSELQRDLCFAHDSHHHLVCLSKWTLLSNQANNAPRTT